MAPAASCPGGLPTFGSTENITYTYDPLSRLTDAFYSSGACFRYNYDAGSNVTWSEESITSTRIITYAYDITSRLQTSKVDVETMTWYYNYDANGNLREMTPNGTNPANGAIRYTYNAANQLNKIETHNGSAYSTLAQMAYDGIGSRVVLTGWVSGVAYTTTYASRIAGKVQILQAKSGVNATSYLYGLNQIGEFGSQSVYYLTDGVGSIRHLVDPNGAVKLAQLYEPFGQVLAQTGTGDPIYGYLGAQLDRISGLLYIDGRYYDPVTGRFLSPSSGGSNLYVPLGGAALAPILILALIGRRRKGKIWTGWVVIALMVSAGLTLAACGGQPTPSQPKPPAMGISQRPTATPTEITPATTAAPPQAPQPTLTSTCTPTSSPTTLPSGVPTPPDGWRWQLAPLDSPGTLFKITHYNTTLESKHPVPSDQAGVAPQGLGLQRKVSGEFLSQVIIQGSGYLDLGAAGDYNGYFGYKYASGTMPETAEFLRTGTDCARGANKCVRSMETGATTMSQIDREATGLAIFGDSPAGNETGTVVYIEQLNRQIRINDTGGAVGKYQIDVYTGIEGSSDDTQFTTILQSKVWRLEKAQ